MEKTGIEPPEEEEEERPVVNGNDVTVTPGLFFLICNAFLLFTESSVTSFCSDSMHVQIRMFLSNWKTGILDTRISLKPKTNYLTSILGSHLTYIKYYKGICLWTSHFEPYL